MHESILETIGRTPIVRINHLGPPGVNLFAKVEAFNPMGSVKDRMALSTIEAAKRGGALKPGQTVIEATSGNTGIGLAMVCAVKGHPLVVTMAESFSIERRKILRFLGAKVVLTPAELKGSGMVAKAEELAEAHDWFLVRQFENEANADAHVRTTAEEILADFGDRTLDYFVTGFGTGGTLKGTSQVLRERSPKTRIVLCEPDNSQVIGSGIPQARHSDGRPDGSHPMFRPHLMQGWSPDFIPKLTEDALAAGRVDEVLPIDGNQALDVTRALAQREGIFSGVSGGATLTGAIEVAKRAPEGSNVLCMLPDTGERYLSTPVFEDIAVEMNEEEVAISRSTPGFRFDRPKPQEPEKLGEPEPPPPAPEVTPEAEHAARAAIDDPAMPVVMFALEWCEFCWSVRKLFDRLGIPYRSMDLDSVAFQEDDMGGKLRAFLLRDTGTPTVPQIYIGGDHLGGATDLFNALQNGDLARRLEPLGISMTDLGTDFDPAALLPGWLHSR
jgi:cysteine synthase A